MRMQSISGSYSDHDDLRSFSYVAMGLQKEIKKRQPKFSAKIRKI